MALISQQTDKKALTIRDITITCRDSDGYINATQLCRAGGKGFKSWYRLNEAKDVLNAISAAVQICTADLVIYVNNGSEDRATWVHPRVAVVVAEWISPEFHANVAGWIHELAVMGKVELGKEHSNEEIMREQIRKLKHTIVEKDKQLVEKDNTIEDLRAMIRNLQNDTATMLSRTNHLVDVAERSNAELQATRIEVEGAHASAEGARIAANAARAAAEATQQQLSEISVLAVPTNISSSKKNILGLFRVINMHGVVQSYYMLGTQERSYNSRIHSIQTRHQVRLDEVQSWDAIPNAVMTKNCIRERLSMLAAINKNTIILNPNITEDTFVDAINTIYEEQHQ